MKKTIVLAIAGVAISALMLGAGVYAGQRTGSPAPATADADGTSVDRAGIEAIVRNYLITNPEVMIEVQAALESKQEEAQKATQLATIDSARDDIFNGGWDGTLGNPDGKITLVEFFDYNCGYCKRAVADLDALIDGDPDLRVVMKEFPILGPDSQKAHLVSMAFRTLQPEKWPDFHHGLMTGAGRADEAAAIEMAVSLGADEAALRKEMENPKIAQAFNATYELANKLSITGTPSYVVGNEVVFGALGAAVLEEKVATAREACGPEAVC